MQGDIPFTAIVTGAVDATECALRKIGVDDSEFTNPPQQGGNGRINLFLGASPIVANQSGPGAQIDANTPSETQLWGGPTPTINQYDLVMFSCQGTETQQTSDAQTNVIDYANAGGRVYATHYSYVWLYNDPPFSSTATWDVNEGAPLNQPAAINQNFPEGKQLAQWLFDIGASTTLGQIPISVLREDFNGVVAPSELWLQTNASSIPMQYTFNTPVGSSAANQCGRVQFNDYHVDEDTTNTVTTGVKFSQRMLRRGDDASGKVARIQSLRPDQFLAPDSPPTITVGVANSPTDFKPSDTGDTITINVSNSAAQTAATSTLIVAATLPTRVMALTMTDASGGWTCNSGTLSCARSTGLNAGAERLDT